MIGPGGRGTGAAAVLVLRLYRPHVLEDVRGAFGLFLGLPLFAPNDARQLWLSRRGQVLSRQILLGPR